ncbi:glycosyltransferase family 2 protein [Roseomonas sp. CCTCC AB2023176]|uniref:glycosyltransferase family 2 protein n=1 Tax=Roseomonas sp. CCTCC AB2023176 TaxID=3342640 RepID=UPI0035DD9CA5
MTPPAISVVCPVFDTPSWMLRAAVRSVLDQEGGEAVEVILADDGSREQGTLAALADLAVDPRVVIARSARNLGPAGSRNAGIRLARGARVGFLDSDDLWPPGSLAARLAAPAGPGDAVLGAFREFGEDGETEAVAAAGPPDDWTVNAAPDSTRHLIHRWHHLGGLLVPRAALDRGGLFDEDLRYAEDFLFFLRVSLACRMVVTERPLYLLRRQHVSMMFRRARYAYDFARPYERAYADPAFRDVRRDLRWQMITVYKGMAANSLVNGDAANALRCAARAYRLDPREVGPLAMFLRATGARDPERRLALARRYTTAIVTPGMA